jgi:hypothetical protein
VDAVEVVSAGRFGFYIQDPWFPATISSSFSYTLTDDLGQVDRCLIQTR